MVKEGSVLAAVDLSEISAAVVRAGLGAARRLGKGLAVVHAVEALTGDEESGPLLPSLRRRVERLRNDARAGLNRVLAQAQLDSSADCVAKTLDGKAWHRIVEVARSSSSSLIVLGSPHPGVAIGSVPDRVLRHCATPVLIIRRPPAGGYRSVFVGVDYSPECEVAWNTALALSEEGARFVACHVLEGSERAPSEAVRAAEEKLSNWAGSRSAPALFRVLVEQGEPRSVLLVAARREAADLLAVGAHSHGLLGDLLPLHVAEAAADSASCDVLVAGRANTAEAGQ